MENAAINNEGTLRENPVKANASREGESNQVKSKLPNNAFTIPTAPGIDFFKWWCVFLRPFIKLTNRETEIIASFLNQRWLLSKKISDPTILDTMIMSETIKNKVIKECHITQQHFYVVMSNLRKNKVIQGNSINSRLIPNIRKDDNGCFQLMILFKEI